jgi:UDP-N-acetylglucosamine 2-epimerase (non-hydrolysing)
MKIVIVVGTRPNFMKVAPILAALRQHPKRFTPYLVHTGQHYDYRMSEVFFKDLGMPPPDAYLDAEKAAPVVQNADIMRKFAPLLENEKPDLVVVVGDVTSTLACTITAVMLHIPVAHVEAGLRSRDRSMPEELTRLATDALADMLFTYSANADANLLAENVPSASIFRIGNLMIDTLVSLKPRAAASPILDKLKLTPQGYGLVTLHRPANVDQPGPLSKILQALGEIQQRLPLVFQIHPRTKKNIETFGLAQQLSQMANVQLLEPQGYIDFLRLQQDARLALVDSGGIQEETTVLGVPCLTLRDNTERPETITVGTNLLVGTRPQPIVEAAFKVLDGHAKQGSIPDLWDGRSAERLVAVLQQGVVHRAH